MNKLKISLGIIGILLLIITYIHSKPTLADKNSMRLDIIATKIWCMNRMLDWKDSSALYNYYSQKYDSLSKASDSINKL